MSTSQSPLIPRWAQFTIGALVLLFAVIIATKHTFYVSDWNKGDSNFYDNTMAALQQSQISIFKGSIPTLVVFWSMDCKDCQSALRALKTYTKDINVIGVHLMKKGVQKTAARQWWVANARKDAPLYFDSSTMLENTFLIRETPSHFLFFPKRKEVLSHAGHLKWAKPTISELRANSKNH